MTDQKDIYEVSMVDGESNELNFATEPVTQEQLIDMLQTTYETAINEMVKNLKTDQEMGFVFGITIKKLGDERN